MHKNDKEKEDIFFLFLAKTRVTKADPNEVKQKKINYLFKINVNLIVKVNQEVLDGVENEKKNLLSQLRDYEWRLEQENKVIKF